ncbi:MAG: TIGR00730 family Rossman fold protein [Lachnospiraceae bacterium]|nr:TIGR00730 family Rossman fold protein [Lachnospiraceae bacterium]
MNITVYLGSNEGKTPGLRSAVRELGTWIGSAGHSLVYGGSKRGLMGELAESVLLAGGEVIGVEPQFFIDMGFEYPEITRLIVTRDMSERKAKMIELGDAFIAFPGGTGTLEEISEIMSKVVLGHLDTPCIVYNLNGYYDCLRALLDRMVEEELSSDEKLKGISFVSNLEEIRKILESAYR